MGSGDSDARDQLFERVYDELKNLARSQIARHGSSHTLQPTALVNEAYIKLIQVEDPSFQSRRHFYALAAKVMRSLLANHARTKNAVKRGGDHEILHLDTQTPNPSRPDETIDLLDLGLALEDLEQLDEQLARIAELRFLAGLSAKEIAETMDNSVRTTERRLQVVNSWLRDRFQVA